MKIAILGYGSQGVSALEYWQNQGYEITVCEQDESLLLPEGVDVRLGESYLQNLEDFELIVRSPSVHPEEIVRANPNDPDILKRVTTNTNEFLRVCPSRNIIGVTGTKGKGTTSTLITRILEAAGLTAHLGGNIGIPPLEMLKNGIRPDDWVVLEMANFQLIDVTHSPHIGVCLMVEPEHMDWHNNTDEYANAKQQMFRWQSADDIAVFYAQNDLSRRIAEAGKGKKIPYMESPGAVVSDGKIIIGETEICDVSDIKLLGEHNRQNVCAAVTAVWQIIQKVEPIRDTIKTFTGLPCRLEFIREVNGVKFYNDSFGTTPETAMVALEAFEQPKVVILGGSDKGAGYDKLAQTVADNNVRAVVAIGETGTKIAEKLRAAGFENIVDGGGDMAAIVQKTIEQARPGDIVLLSTASASFDMFRDYKDRGEQFNQAVRSLA